MDPEIVFYIIMMILMAFFSNRFSKVTTTTFKHLRDNDDKLMISVWSSIFGVMFVIGKDHLGMACMPYQIWVFISPAMTAIPSLLVAMIIICDMNTSLLLSHEFSKRSWLLSKLSRYLPSADVMRGLFWYIFSAMVTVHLLGTVIHLAVKFEGRLLDASSESCTLESELYAVGIIFIVYMIFFVFIIILFGTGYIIEYRVASTMIVLVTLSNFLSLLCWLAVNFSQNSYDLFERNMFDPELFAVWFYFGQILVIIVFTQIHDFWINGGSLCGRQMWVRNSGSSKRGSDKTIVPNQTSLHELGPAPKESLEMARNILATKNHEGSTFNCIFAGVVGIIFSRCNLDFSWPGSKLMNCVVILTSTDIADSDSNTLVKLSDEDQRVLRNISLTLKIKSITRLTTLETLTRLQRSEILSELSFYIGKSLLSYPYEKFTSSGDTRLFEEDDYEDHDPGNTNIHEDGMNLLKTGQGSSSSSKSTQKKHMEKD